MSRRPSPMMIIHQIGVLVYRMTGKERAIGRGLPQFIANTDLQYDAAKGTRYVKDGIIIVRVVGVKITQ